MANYVDAGGIGSENRGAANIVLDAGAGDNRAAVVFIAYWDNGASRTFTITAGGVEAGAPVAQVGNANDGLILAYVIPGIPAGEITVSVTPSQTLAEGFFLVSTWDSVPQASPVVDSAIIAGNTGPSITIPTMSVGANEVGVGALYYYVAGASNPVASDTAMGTPFTAGISRATHQRGDGTLGWTGLGTGGGSMAVGIVLGHDDGAAEPDPPPTIVSVDDDNTITSAQAGAVIAGANFSSATVEIRQGAVVVEQTVTAQDDDEITFNVVFDLSPDPSLRFGAATLAVINDDEQEDTIAISIVPPAGQLYVDVVDPVQDPDQALTADPAAATGDQVHIRGVGGGAAPAGLTVNPNMTFEFDPGAEPEAFEFRFWDASDSAWGDWAERGVLGVAELVVAGANHGHAADTLVLVQASVLTVQGAAHGHAAAGIDLTQASVLAPAGAAHDQAADSVELVQAHVLVVADALHQHSAANVMLEHAMVLDVGGAIHGHSASGVQLSLADILAVASSIHEHTTDEIELTQQHVLIVSDAVHAQIAELVNVRLPGLAASREVFMITAEDRIYLIAPETQRVVN